MLDGRREYVVHGVRGTVAYLGLGTQSGAYGAKGGLATVDYAEAETLRYDDAARTRFTLVLSATRPADATNWLRLVQDPPEAMFIVRQTFGRRTEEEAASLSIALRGDGGGSGGGTPLTPKRLDDGLQSASVLVAGASAMFAKWAYGFQAHANTLPLFDQQTSDRAGGDPNIRYYHSYWRLPAGMALRIRVRPPPCRCWNFQLNSASRRSNLAPPRRATPSRATPRHATPRHATPRHATLRLVRSLPSTVGSHHRAHFYRRPLDGEPRLPALHHTHQRQPGATRRGRPCALHADRLARRPERRRHIPRQLDSDGGARAGHDVLSLGRGPRGGRRAAPPSGGGPPHRATVAY